jgi:hypothetical protein
MVIHARQFASLQPLPAALLVVVRRPRQVVEWLGGHDDYLQLLLYEQWSILGIINH